jgi:DUF177 domain-containing protein
VQLTDVFDLGRLELHSGEGRRIETYVAIEPVELGGQRYTAASAQQTPVVLDVSQTTSGYSLRLRQEVLLSGPCMRCLQDATHVAVVDAREVDQPGGGEELDSPYVEGDELLLREWARDALVLALPVQILCSAACLGLCAECGVDLNEAGPDHRHERARDPRFAKLSELRLK